MWFRLQLHKRRVYDPEGYIRACSVGFLEAAKASRGEIMDSSWSMSEDDWLRYRGQQCNVECGLMWCPHPPPAPPLAE